jgi:hypothetical protein
MILTPLCRAALSGMVAVATAAAAPPDVLSLADLANRPDRWPETVTLQKDFTFANGAMHKGDKVHPARFDGAHLVVATPAGMSFSAEPGDCGLLDAANQAWTALTPAQRAVEPESLAADPSLWPLRVSTTAPISCKFGKLGVGTEVGLRGVSGKGAEIGWPDSPNWVNVDFAGTDLIGRARQLVLVEPAKRPSRIAAALHGVLVDSEGKAYPDDKLADKQIFALYFGANWCAPCHEFSPVLVKFLNDAMPKHPELAAVLLSNDDRPDQMLAYMTSERMPFPAVPLKDLNRSAVLSGFSARTIPHLVIVDRFGRVLASNDDDHGHRTDPEDTLGELTKRLEAPAGLR